MSKFNYSTTRNRPIKLSVPNKVLKYKLESKDIKVLTKKYFMFNDWEMKFYKSIKYNKWNIISGKQWSIIKELLAK